MRCPRLRSLLAIVRRYRATRAPLCRLHPDGGTRTAGVATTRQSDVALRNEDPRLRDHERGGLWVLEVGMAGSMGSARQDVRACNRAGAHPTRLRARSDPPGSTPRCPVAFQGLDPPISLTRTSAALR